MISRCIKGDVVSVECVNDSSIFLLVGIPFGITSSPSKAFNKDVFPLDVSPIKAIF